MLNRDVSFAFNQLSIYLKSGLPLVSCLEFTSSDISNKNLKNIFLSISKELSNGEELYSSFSKYFDSNFILSLVEAGESAGILSFVLEKMSAFDVIKKLALLMKIYFRLIFRWLLIFIFFWLMQMYFNLLVTQINTFFVYTFSSVFSGIINTVMTIFTFLFVLFLAKKTKDPEQVTAYNIK